MLSPNKKNNLPAQPTCQSPSLSACQSVSHPVCSFSGTSDTEAECPTDILAGQLAIGWTWSWLWAADGCLWAETDEWAQLSHDETKDFEFLGWKCILQCRLNHFYWNAIYVFSVIQAIIINVGACCSLHNSVEPGWITGEQQGLEDNMYLLQKKKKNKESMLWH